MELSESYDFPSFLEKSKEGTGKGGKWRVKINEQLIRFHSFHILTEHDRVYSFGTFQGLVSALEKFGITAIWGIGLNTSLSRLKA